MVYQKYSRRFSHFEVAFLASTSFYPLIEMTYKLINNMLKMAKFISMLQNKHRIGFQVNARITGFFLTLSPLKCDVHKCLMARSRFRRCSALINSELILNALTYS